MKRKTKNALICINLVAAGDFFSSTALADFYQMAPSHEVDQCIAEVRERADYRDALRVRHEIESERRRTVGYKLAIETTVYPENGEQPVREYTAICEVAGGRAPLSFSMRQKGGGA